MTNVPYFMFAEESILPRFEATCQVHVKCVNKCWVNLLFAEESILPSLRQVAKYM